MSRLIDADALKEQAHWVIRSDGTRVWVIHTEDIDEAPTIDPAKHGHWIEGGENDCLCSCCRSGWYVFDDEEDLKMWERLTLFCPNCGAKMCEEVTENENTE